MLRWERQSDRRYYKAWLQRDLFGDFCLFYSHGSIGTTRGNWHSIPCKNIDHAKYLLRETFKARKKKGYELFPEKSDYCTVGNKISYKSKERLHQPDLFV